MEAGGDFFFVEVEGFADGVLEFFAGEWLEKILERPGEDRSLDSHFIGVGGQENHRRSGFSSNGDGRGDAVQIAFERDVHENQIGLQISRGANDILGGISDADDLMAHVGEFAFQRGRRDGFVFRD